jgi:putative hydrolase of the HAD superfamily
MIRAVFVDLDDTLLDEQGASARGFDALWAAFPGGGDEGRADALARWRRVSSANWRRFESGQCSFQEQRRGRVRDFTGLPFTDDEADRAWDVYGRVYEAAWARVPGCEAFLTATAGLVRIAVTNGERTVQRRKVKAAGLDAHLDAVVTPADAGAWKPQSAIFVHAFELARARRPDLVPAEVLMVGDDESRDIAPATALGYATARVEPGNPEPSLQAAIRQLH